MSAVLCNMPRESLMEKVSKDLREEGEWVMFLIQEKNFTVRKQQMDSSQVAACLLSVHKEGKQKGQSSQRDRKNIQT